MYRQARWTILLRTAVQHRSWSKLMWKAANTTFCAAVIAFSLRNVPSSRLKFITNRLRIRSDHGSSSMNTPAGGSPPLRNFPAASLRGPKRTEGRLGCGLAEQTQSAASSDCRQEDLLDTTMTNR